MPAAQASETYDRHHKGAPKNSASLYYHKTFKKSRQYQDNKENKNEQLNFIYIAYCDFIRYYSRRKAYSFRGLDSRQNRLYCRQNLYILQEIERQGALIMKEVKENEYKTL